MALKIIEGFDHMSTTTLVGLKGWTFSGSSPIVSSIISGRFTGNAYRLTSVSGANTGSLSKTLPSSYAHPICGFAFRFSAVPIADSLIFAFRTGTTETLRLLLNTGTNRLSLRTSAGTVIATGTAGLVANTWYYIEVEAFVNGASGTAALKLNGVSEIASTTANIGSANIDNIYFFINSASGSGSRNQDYDDIYVLDTASSPNNTFLGDVRVSTIYPSADGAHTDFTPDTGTAHFSRVNESTGTYPDDDTTYVASSTVGNRDSYTHGDLTSATGTIFALQTNLYARKDDASVRQIAAVARPVATDRDGATATLGATYSTFTEIRETNPDTSAAWAISEVNASEFGVKVVA